MKIFTKYIHLFFAFTLITFQGKLSAEEMNNAASADFQAVQTDTIEADGETEKKIDNEKTSFIGNHIWSLDLGYMAMGIREQGWGLGINYEQQIFNCFSIKGGFAHYTLWPYNDDFDMIVNVGIKIDALFYPFGDGMDKLYIGLGSGSEFLSYIGDNIPEDSSKDAAITIFPEIGWKQNFFNVFMADFFFGYRILLNQYEIYDPAIDYVSHGPEYGIKLKLNLTGIMKKMFH